MKNIYILQEDKKGLYFKYYGKKLYVKDLKIKYTLSHDNTFIVF